MDIPHLKRSLLGLHLIFGLLFPALPGWAASLQGLTPLGAIRAGNAEATIPPWEGGITKLPPCYKLRTFHCDPFSVDQPLFTITARNVDLHAEKLSPGQAAMLRHYPKTWRMTVYPSRRSASFPQHVYDASIANATRAKLQPTGTGVLNAIGGVPFPIPKEGIEVIWNHLLRYRGETTHQMSDQVTPTARGRYTIVRMEQKAIWPYHFPGATIETIQNRLMYFKQSIIGPARVAGRILLVHEPIDLVKNRRMAWSYIPGQRRVRRNPDLTYDRPGTSSDGQRTIDQNDMYNGSPGRYDWTLVGRKEMYVPYNSYKLHSDKVTYDEIIKPGHINPDLLRYERHRVWVVEAKLKEGARHLYARRTFYLDEDSWQILAVDQYDRHGKIWRVSEAHVINYYEVPLLWQTLEAHYDLQNGRYLLLGLNNRRKVERFNSEMDPKNFKPEALRREGRR